MPPHTRTLNSGGLVMRRVVWKLEIEVHWEACIVGICFLGFYLTQLKASSRCSGQTHLNIPGILFPAEAPKNHKLHTKVHTRTPNLKTINLESVTPVQPVCADVCQWALELGLEGHEGGLHQVI